MKLFLFFALTLSTAFANAMTTKECNLKTMLETANMYARDVKLSDGRTTGSDAKDNFQRAARVTGAAEGIDELGVVRYLSTSERSLVETDNGEINSCDGKNTVYLTRKCTTSADSKNTVCETFCSREWRGWECR